MVTHGFIGVINSHLKWAMEEYVQEKEHSIPMRRVSCNGCFKYPE